MLFGLPGTLATLPAHFPEALNRTILLHFPHPLELLSTSPLQKPDEDPKKYPMLADSSNPLWRKTPFICHYRYRNPPSEVCLGVLFFIQPQTADVDGNCSLPRVQFHFYANCLPAVWSFFRRKEADLVPFSRSCSLGLSSFVMLHDATPGFAWP